ncbi:MAG: type 1 glutamine amidotransferase [Candidatus Thorarchaeota archaeon]
MNGYGYPISKRLNSFGVKHEIIPIAENTSILPELPKKPLILSGGMTEVTANVDWINDLKAYISQIIKQNQENPRNMQPILGICFGAQIIAESYRKGSVRFLEDPEFGLSRIVLEDNDLPIFKGFENEFDAYSFHYNQIWSTDFQILSKHKHMGHEFLQAFEVPDSTVFGVQFHPEFTREQMIRLFNTYQNLILEFGFDLQPIIDDLENIKGNEKILRNFIDEFC